MHKALPVFTSVVLLTSAISGCGGNGGGATPAHMVAYDGNGSNGGAIPVDTGAYHEGDTVTVLGNTGSLEKTGYAFNGWSRSADGSGTIYTPGQTLTMGSAEVTLYARWTQNPTYTVNYDGNGSTGGSVPVDATHYQVGQTVFVLGNTGTLTRTGYSFNGWNSQADGSGTTYGASFAMGSANVTLYARWTLNPTYTVNYDGNGNTGGTAPVDSTHYEAGQTVFVLGNTGNLTRTGYSFNGWNSQANGSGATYGASFAMGSANVTLYARWTLNPTYAVTYDGNGSTGGTAPVDSTHYEAGQTVTVLNNTGGLTRSGYTFGGWNTAAGGGGTSYTGGQTFVMGVANVTLYAKWALIPTFTVTYNGNGNTRGSVPIDAIHYQTGQTVTVLGNSGNLLEINVSGTSSRFSGWNSQADGGGIDYQGGSTFAMGAANVTLYAKYTPFALRDTGPAGGLVFYDRGSYSNDWRYLEAAPSDQANGPWVPGTAAEAPETGAGDSEIGAGKHNTELIVTAFGTNNTYAARTCAELVLNGYDDWFLPSRFELHSMYHNLAAEGMGGFQPTVYWSSTQYYRGYALMVGFAADGCHESTCLYFGAGDQALRIRPIRAF